MPHYPSAELVSVAWAKTVVGDVDPTKVATSLPADTTVWATSGFTTATVLNGNPDPDVPLFGPVVAFDCWAAAVDSNRAPWGQAGAMAAAIGWATYRRTVPALVMPADYFPARLLSVFPVGDPQRIPSDGAGFARVRIPVQFAWTTTAEVAA